MFQFPANFDVINIIASSVLSKAFEIYSTQHSTLNKIN